MKEVPPRIRPAPGQESVWDYPSPPRLEQVTVRLRVEFGGYTIADTIAGLRVLHTGHPPLYFFPPDDVHPQVLTPAQGITVCEFKGVAAYWDASAGGREVERAAWSYPDPSEGYEEMANHVAFYASKMDACFVGDEEVRTVERDFFGGWITSKVIGPFRGAPDAPGW